MVVVVCCWILVAGSGLKHCAEMMMKNCVCFAIEILSLFDCVCNVIFIELVIKTILLLGEEHDRLFLWLGEEAVFVAWRGSMRLCAVYLDIVGQHFSFFFGY
ncbi:hypothetical protein MtrunA17_Chr7g0230851 [Medicago truncatula]|uniref:Transmembrane protein n=1 Tax=Medicago truncatula TaxID=3880 RepID=A0A396GY39_MEDTR|nr:hypothetical protein MtrunA17_Chr7g0230851 [Medicago truncatula]